MSHPRVPFFDQLSQPRESARALGYRMPAEWEPLARVWLTPPFKPETWPGCLEQAQAQFRDFMAALGQHVTIATTQQLGAPTNDSWIRDYGPIFVVRKSGTPQSPGMAMPGLCAHDFHFNAWGGKYESRDLDDVIPQHIAKHLGVPLWVHDMVLEGGSIDVNGVGTVMTTEQCLLNKNRNPRKSKEEIIEAVHEALGTRQAIWLPGGIVGDDTDGHIDDIARFVNADTVVAVRARPGHPDFEILERNWQVLQQARDQDGRKLTVIALPAPEPITYRFPPNRFGPGGVNPVPASYANFLIANGGVFVPIFGRKSDEQALRILEQAMPNHKIVGLRAEHLVVGLGTFHCLSQQEPA